MQAADDAEGDGSLQAEGCAQRDGPVADLHRFRVTERGLGRQITAVQTHQSQIRHRIGADDLSIALFAVGQGDAHRFHPLHHVGIGEHQAVAVDHDAGSLPTLAFLAKWWIAEQIPQQGIDECGIKTLTLHGALGVDPDDSGCHLLHGIRDEAVLKSQNRGCIGDQAGRCRQHHQQLTQGEPQHKTV